MEKQEAVAVVNEVLSVCKCFLDPTHLSITDLSAQIRMKSTGYEVYIKLAPTDDLRECLMPVLTKHQLRVAELEEAMIIYKPAAPV